MFLEVKNVSKILFRVYSVVNAYTHIQYMYQHWREYFYVHISESELLYLSRGKFCL